MDQLCSHPNCTRLAGRPTHGARGFCGAHYINGDRTDNRIENLELWTSPQPTGVRAGDLTTMITSRGTVIVARL